MHEPLPLTHHLVVVGGDACFAEQGDDQDEVGPWRAVWMAVLVHLNNLVGPGCLVAHGPQKGSPDVMASVAAFNFGHIDRMYSTPDADELCSSPASITSGLPSTTSCVTPPYCCNLGRSVSAAERGLASSAVAIARIGRGPCRRVFCMSLSLS